MTPDRCIAMFVSKIVEQEQDLNKERWYGTQFKKVKLQDDFIAHL